MQVLTFGAGHAEPARGATARFGAKAAGLARLHALGLPVPPGFCLSVAVCDAVRRADGPEALAVAHEALWLAVEEGLDFVEQSTGLRFGDSEGPLMLAVRAAPTVSQPGVLATVLNVGLDWANPSSASAQIGDAAYDCAWHLLNRYLAVVSGAEGEPLADLFESSTAALGRGARFRDLDAGQAQSALDAAPAVIAAAGLPVPPRDARQQLKGAIEGVLASWSSRRAVRHRRRVGLPDEPGVAVVVQAMAFGNLDAASGAGVFFTRDPNTGAEGVFGEFLVGAQGPDLMDGLSTPGSLFGAGSPFAPASADGVPQPDAAGHHLSAVAAQIEAAFGDLVEVEFTVSAGRLWLLQCRSAARSARAAVCTAVALADQGLIDRAKALGQVAPEFLTRLLNPSVDLRAVQRPLARGLPASPGAVYGAVVFDPDEAIARGAAGEDVVLVLRETVAEDLGAFRAAVGVLTARGGMTSHAALMARGIGRCCVVGCSSISVDAAAGHFTVRPEGVVVAAGTVITLDGTTGEVYLGAVATRPADPPAALPVLLTWADEVRRLGVRVSVDDPAEAERGLAAGADGVGLTRTERLFLDADRVSMARELVLAYDTAARRRALAPLEPVQRADFVRLFSIAAAHAARMDRPCPVTVRLLDLPLDDLVTDDGDALAAMASRLDVPARTLGDRMRALRTRNPQLGLRGCRLGLMFPEVYAIQARAIFEAACDLDAAAKTPGVGAARVPLEIVLPLVSSAAEVRLLRQRIESVAADVSCERGRPPPEWLLGAMIESPRACLIAAELADVADYFLFGTNDLTSATFCVHRDDAGRFLPSYLEQGLLPHDPFVTLDEAVVRLIGMAVAEGRARRPDLRCALSGAQANDPRTVRLAAQLGLDEVSVAAHRVPIARLAAAQAAAVERLDR